MVLTEQVRFRQRLEGGEGDLAKWPSAGRELQAEGRARVKIAS